MKKRLKKGTSEKFWAHFEVLYYKQSSEFMIPAFHDYSLEPKITKCGDLLYNVSLSLLLFTSAFSLHKGPTELGRVSGRPTVGTRPPPTLYSNVEY